MRRRARPEPKPSTRPLTLTTAPTSRSSTRLLGQAPSRQIDLEAAVAAVAWEATRVAAVVAGDLPHEREAQAESLAGLGRSGRAVERLEDVLDEAGITCSMSRRGDCWDNAVAESFFGTLKTELIYELPLQTRSATRSAVVDYIEAFYNVRRRHSSLDYQSPLEFELKNGELGDFAPGPPGRNERERGKEGPDLTV